MSADPFVTREEQLPKLQAFCSSLDGLFVRAGMTPEQSQEVWRLGVAAECVRCGIRIYGEELHTLSQPPSEKCGNAKLGRLRLGDCARSGCNAYTYRLTFYPCGQLDWQTLLGSLDANAPEPGKKDAVESMLRPAWGLLLHSRVARRLALALAIVVLLLLVRQWYIGGRIPLLREGQSFQGAPESTRFPMH